MNTITINLDRFEDYESDYFFLKDKKKKYDNYHMAIYLSHIFDKKRTMINAGVHYIEAVQTSANFWKNVYGFEPDSCYKNLCKKIEDLKIRNFILYNTALSNSISKRRFFSPVEDLENRNHYVGNSSLTRNYTEDVDSSIPFYARDVITQVLDHIVEECNIKNIDYIKADTEHEDYAIIQGAVNTIKKYKPIVQAEETGKKFDKLMFSMNYRKVLWSTNIDKLNPSEQRDTFYLHEELL
jgi:FkbM family methyltransferase